MQFPSEAKLDWISYNFLQFTQYISEILKAVIYIRNIKCCEPLVIFLLLFSINLCTISSHHIVHILISSLVITKITGYKQGNDVFQVIVLTLLPLQQLSCAPLQDKI